MIPPCTDRWHSYIWRVRNFSGALLTSQLKWHYKTDHLRSIERAIFPEQFRIPEKIEGRQRRTVYPCAISKYQRGKLPSDDRFDKIGDACPSVRCLPDLPLLDTLDQLGRGPRNFDYALQCLSVDVKAVLCSRSGVYIARYLSLEDSFGEAVLAPLRRLGTVDALTALLVLAGEQQGLDSQPNLKATLEATRHVFLRLIAFPPFYGAREPLRKLLTILLGRKKDIAFEIETSEAEARANEIRALLGAVGRLKLLAPTLMAQMSLAYQFREQGHGIATIAAIEAIYYAAYRRGEKVSVEPGHPLYQLLKGVRHRSARSNRAIVFPRKRHPSFRFEIANALADTVGRHDDERE